ncbi:MAG TPA: tRNA (adenosine(37)-N6)-threonylcarbamoyltransferase complex dimerization subunit type 1 TsaB [Bacteroidales bacterium]|nr:tRNA (adenosine(37)-N6)-threonylcarbamoyltransferase complex dimerization subunit type 1 TsaB [Bacteroidales bacterium]
MNDNLPLILNIETSTQICSVALAKGNTLIAKRLIDIPNAHSSKLSLLVEEVMKEGGITYSQLSAIAVSKGPGSYTGLRIGVSTAKGFAYALDIPLISVETLRILEKGVQKAYPNKCTVSMIDARRMEVYSIIYDEKGNIIKDISADIIEKGIYDNYLKQDKEFVFVGDGAEKTMEFFDEKTNIFYDKKIILDAELMTSIAYDKFMEGDFEDVAYFEPYYLKNFVAGVSKVKGLY